MSSFLTSPQHLRPRRILRRESLKISPRHILRWESWRDMSDSLSLPGGSRDWGAWQINCGSDFPFFLLVCSCFSPTRWLDGSRGLLFVRWETLCLLIGADEQVTRPTTWSPLLFRQSSRKLLLELGTQIVQGWVKHLETFSKQIPPQKLPFRFCSWYLRKIWGGEDIFVRHLCSWYVAPPSTPFPMRGTFVSHKCLPSYFLPPLHLEFSNTLPRAWRIRLLLQVEQDVQKNKNLREAPS